MVQENAQVTPIYVVLPPWVLLLDVTGAVEMSLRPDQGPGVVHFDVRYDGQSPLALNSVGTP
jgi:hypothetical protein